MSTGQPIPDGGRDFIQLGLSANQAITPAPAQLVQLDVVLSSHRLLLVDNGTVAKRTGKYAIGLSSSIDPSSQPTGEVDFEFWVDGANVIELMSDGAGSSSRNTVGCAWPAATIEAGQAIQFYMNCTINAFELQANGSSVPSNLGPATNAWVWFVA